MLANAELASAITDGLLITVIDKGSMGGGVIEELEEEGFGERVVAVPFDSSPDDEVARRRHTDKRALMLWGLRELILSAELHLPHGDESEMLADEMASVKWGETASGKKRIEAKTDVKKRLGRSPDVSDSVALAVMPTAVEEDWEPIFVT